MRIVALALLAGVAAAQAPNAQELVRLSAGAIGKLKSYQIRTITLIDMQGGPFDNTVEMPATVSVRRPDRMRIESEDQSAGLTVVSDGELTWIYLEPQNAYIKRVASSSPEAMVGQPNALRSLPDLGKSIQSVRLTGQETLDIDGAAYPCWTVETRFGVVDLPSFAAGGKLQDAVQISWIDKQRHLILKNTFRARIVSPALSEPVRMSVATHTAMLKVNPELPDSLFSFTPPEDAKEKDDWTLPGIQRPDVIGKPVPGLATGRGKVVLLYFQTAWSGPSQRDLPVVQKLSHEFREQGLEVMVIDAEQNSALIKSLSIGAFPTVVLVDREGKVVSYEAGARGEAALRGDLAKVGIKTLSRK
jgi:outer membrane lipoprotein-sorting protein